MTVRASSPVEDRSTQHGSSLTSSGAAELTGSPADSRSTVRRGVPCGLATSASSLETVLAQQLLVAEDRLELLDAGAQLVALGLEVEPGELGQAAQLQVEDVVGLDLGEVEDAHQAGAGRGRVLAACG